MERSDKVNSIPREAVQTHDEKLKKLFREQLKKQLVIGMSYGAKAVSQTIKDMINVHIEKREEQDICLIPTELKDDLLKAIIHFVNTTVSSDAEEISQIISSKIE